MDYRRFGDALYIRADRGDEIISSLLDVCKREGIRSATFSGIGGCSVAEIQVFNPDEGSFSTEQHEGVLELVSLMGNVADSGTDEPAWHAHALFTYLEGEAHAIASGHLKSATVLYTAEVELHPVIDGVIGTAPDAETGTRFWHFE